jgi:glycosyltransferase involved in cell wall biosynthesis
MGGAENITLAIIRNDKVHNHVVLVFRGLTDFQAYCQEAHHLQFINLFWTTNSVFSLSNWKSLFRSIRKIKPSIIQSYMFDASQYARIAGLFFKIPVVIYVVNTYKNKIFKRSIINYFLSYITEKIIVCSDDVRNSVIKFDKVKKDKITLLPSFAMFDFKKDHTSSIRKSLDIKKSDYLALFIARLVEQKGIDYLIEAVGICVHKKKMMNLKLIIIGDGELKSKFIIKIKQLNLTNHIFLVGEINHLNTYLTEANVYVDSSLWAGLSVAAIKALEASLPLIMTDVGGAKQLTNNGQFGYLCNPKNSQSLATLIEFCYKNKIAKNAASNRYAKRNFSDSVMAKKVIEIYQEILNKSK